MTWTVNVIDGKHLQFRSMYLYAYTKYVVLLMILGNLCESLKISTV